MSADITAAAAASAAATAASAFLSATFGVPLDAVACGLAGAYIGLHFVKEEMSTGRALRLFIGLGLGAAIVGNWATKDAAGREMASLVVGLIGVPGARFLIDNFGQVISFLQRMKGRP